jgi:hypothetical protein
MPASQKIITKLRERRQIEADLRELLAASSEEEFRRQAQRIAALGSQVIPTIVANLDRADASMLAAMGTVATFLDRDEVAAALRQAVLLPQRTDRGRIGAMTILERFLGEPPDDDLLASLADAEGVAVSSLEQMLAQAADDPALWIEYVQGLDRQEPDLVLALIPVLREMGDGSAPSGPDLRAVEPLRMMAQDVREEIAAEAIEALGAIRLPEAARALQTLLPIVAPALRPVAERLLRRLRFVGVEVSDLPGPDPNWRALLSPVDGLGRQSVWFVLESRWTSRARFLNVLLNGWAGATQAVGHSQVPALMLPPRRPLGELHDVALPDGSGALLLVEAPFDVGRRLIVEALARNRAEQIPVAGALRLLSPWLWAVGGADTLPARVLPELSAEDGNLLAASDRLLHHPAFSTWMVRTAATLQGVEEALHRPGWNVEVWVGRLAGDLFSDPAAARVVSQRLEAMSEWFLLAGDDARSRLALVAAHGMRGSDPQNVPLVRALIRRDLELALRGLERGAEPASERV